MRNTVALLFALSSFLSVHHVQSANILVYFGISSYSHIASLTPLMERLGSLGHNVTLLTPFRPRQTLNSNVSLIYMEEIFNIFKDQWDEGADLIGIRQAGMKDGLWDGILDNAIMTCKAFLEAPSSQALIHNSKFDLVIVDSAFNDCGLALAHFQYKCPFVVYSAVASFPFFTEEYGYPGEGSSIPDLQSDMMGGADMSFLDRLKATWLPLKWLWLKQKYYYPQMSAAIKEHLHLDNDPDLADMHTKTSLVLMNTYHSTDYPRSLPPLFVPVSGIGIQEKRKPIPREMDEFIGKPGTRGFVYVCFGDAVRVSKIDPALRAKLFAAFASFPEVQFVWKWEAAVPENEKVPENIYFSRWLPQQDLFADKRIRGFISHGGMNGINEAMHFGVPMIVFPIFGDQDFNANALAAKKVAILMEITDFTQQQLQDSIQRLLDDKAFKDRVSFASRIHNDRQTKPLDTAIWWIEYVLRNKGTSFLMPLGAQQSWFKRRSLDIWLLVFTICSLVLVLSSWLCFRLVRWTGLSGPSKKGGHSTAKRMSISLSELMSKNCVNCMTSWNTTTDSNEHALKKKRN